MGQPPDENMGMPLSPHSQAALERIDERIKNAKGSDEKPVDINELSAQSQDLVRQVREEVDAGEGVYPVDENLDKVLDMVIEDEEASRE